MEELLLRGAAAHACDASSQFVSAPEAERIIGQLKCLAVEDVGAARPYARAIGSLQHSLGPGPARSSDRQLGS